MIDMTAADEIADDARARSNVVRLAAAQALDRRQFGGDFCHRLDHRRDAGAGYLARDRAAVDVCGRACRRHAADRRDLARLWPPRRLHHRHRLRRADRPARGLRHPARFVSRCFAARPFSAGFMARCRNPIASPPPTAPAPQFRPKAVSWVMAGGVFAGVLGPQLVQWTMDIWPPYLFAFSFVVQAAVALVAMAMLAGVDAPKPAPSDLHGGRPLLEIVRQPRFIAAALCGIISYPMMNLVMTSAPLAMKMCGLERQRFEFRHPVAYRGDVRAELFHGIADRALRRARNCRARSVARGRGRDDRAVRHHRDAFLGHADRARAGLESQLRRRLRAGAGDAPAAGAQQGAGLQRFPGVRDDGGGIVLLRPVAGELRLVGGQHGGVSAGVAGACGAGVGVVRETARARRSRCRNFPTRVSDRLCCNGA